ncbi:hypothetical protein ADK34_17625 [Streptomyces viridochromogenes]|uniref:Uncharacterized protein n=1 Tax=Streptomyces viridochromogenes TaxID=1938 RepID=A0A0L8KII5_STRVR|nr:hypothetical protein ADK34_17625 [Streptomyces viridochromogenes]
MSRQPAEEDIDGHGASTVTAFRGAFGQDRRDEPRKVPRAWPVALVRNLLMPIGPALRLRSGGGER